MDYDDYDGFNRYVSVGARRAQAARELARLQKNGRKLSPVVIEGRTIARTFWGEAWCDNLERYSDFANRLPRGRTYRSAPTKRCPNCADWALQDAFPRHFGTPGARTPSKPSAAFYFWLNLTQESGKAMAR